MEGARTRRWTPNPNTGEPAERGFAKELLLRVEYLRGGQQRLPKQVTGAAAADLEPGRVVHRRRVRFTNGRQIELALVVLGDRYALDQFLDGRRAARIDLPADFRARDGRILKFGAYSQPSDAAGGGVYIEYAGPGSARILSHFLAFFPRGFEFVN